jgi:hypothetical protein
MEPNDLLHGVRVDAVARLRKGLADPGRLSGELFHADVVLPSWEAAVQEPEHRGDATERGDDQPHDVLVVHGSGNPMRPGV